MNKYQWLGIIFVLADMADYILSSEVFHIEPQYGVCFVLGILCFVGGTAMRIHDKRRGISKKKPR